MFVALPLRSGLLLGGMWWMAALPMVTLWCLFGED